jgi:hypothetical protein
MADDENRSLLDWLAAIDEDPDVLKHFREKNLEKALDKAIEKHGGAQHKRVMLENDIEAIGETLERDAAERTEEADASSKPLFWVLVRV